jgi:hypothetical protein
MPPAPASVIAPSPVAAGLAVPQSTAPSGDTRLILRNLAAIGGLGVLILFWVLACTDWFPVVGGLLESLVRDLSCL